MQEFSTTEILIEFSGVAKESARFHLRENRYRIFS